MRLILVALLFAISYAQTVGGEDFSGFSAAVDKINVNPKGYAKMEEEMSTGKFFSHSPVRKEDMEKSVNTDFSSEVKAEKKPSPSLGLSSLATETKSIIPSVLSLGTPKTEYIKEAAAADTMPAVVVTSPLDLKPAKKSEAIPTLDDFFTPSIKTNTGKVSATESSSSYTQKDVVIGFLMLTNAIFLFGWLNACARSKDSLTYSILHDSSLLEEI